MRFSVTGAALALYATLAALPAQAEMTMLARTGAWAAFGGRSNNGTPACVVSVMGNDGRYVGIKHFAGDLYFTVHVRKPSWRIPAGTEMRVNLEVDRAGPWKAMAEGKGDTLEFFVGRNNADALKLFMEEFTAGRQMFLRFPDGGEGDWVVSLTGSRAILAHMVRCMQTLTMPPTQPHSGATQPFGAPTQPFGSPTQPFGAQGNSGRRT